MKANELMIDDWIYNKNIDKPMQVYPTMFSQMFRQRPDAITEDYNIFPIPLTPEILENNGFDVSDPEVSIYRFEENEQVFRFCLRRMYNKDNRPNGYSFYAFSNVLAIIDSVHELQHAFRLCGIDKTIEL